MNGFVGCPNLEGNRYATHPTHSGLSVTCGAFRFESLPFILNSLTMRKGPRVPHEHPFLRVPRLARRVHSSILKDVITWLR
jgi:hypothetical protein